MSLRIVLIVVGALAWLIPARGHATTTSDGCAEVNGLSFVCGAQHPEDLAHIPGTPWLIASGFADGAGIKLINIADKSIRRWYSDGTPRSASNGQPTPCPGPPDATAFNAHGISLRTLASNRYRLYVVNHGGRESIELFDVRMQAEEPQLSWSGCVLLPPGDAGNAVAAYRDGTILTTVLTRPGTTIADFVNGKSTGGVFQWKPGDLEFHLLPGTELPGNNGLEVAPDDHSFFVVAFGWHAILQYDRVKTRTPLRRVIAPGFMPDNIHWDGTRLVAAGMTYDEPACGGLRKVINGTADPMTCHRGYVAAALDTRTWRFSVLAYAEPNPDFNGVSTALPIGDQLWLGSYQADRVAYRPLPDGQRALSP